MRFIQIFLVLLSLKSISQTTYVNNGNATNYTLAAGDSLYIAAGTYTGSINCWVDNTKITVAPGANFRPTAINGYRSSYIIYGQATLPNLNSGAGFELRNFGTTTFTGNPQVNSTVRIHNHQDALINISGNFSINGSNSSFRNEGQVNIAGNFNINGSVSILNTGSISINGNVAASNGDLNNQGLFIAVGSITMSSNAMLNNECRTIAQNGVTFYNSTVYNSGLIWASNAQNNAAFVNHSTLTSSGNGIIKAGAFTNHGRIQGNGNLYITGKSVLGGGGSVGSGVSTDELRIYTVNRTSTSRIFDDQWGTVNTNAFHSVIAAPDTLVPTGGYGCSFVYTPYVILPVEWSDFTVSLVNDIPTLRWSVTGEQNITFEVERSTNGREFMRVAILTETSFRDITAGKTGMAYYRIKSITVDGIQKYSAIETIKLAGIEDAAYQVFPNPFVAQILVRFNVANRNMVTIKIYNTAGQIQYENKMQTVAGSNQMEINNTGNWRPGLYIIHISSENGAAQSMTLMKQ